MRIISQDCDKDLPYESSEVIVDDKFIIAISSSLPRGFSLTLKCHIF